MTKGYSLYKLFGLLDGSSSPVTAASLIRLPPQAGPHFNWNDCGARIRGGAASGTTAAPPDAAIDNTWHSVWPQWGTRRSQRAQVWPRNCWPTNIIILTTTKQSIIFISEYFVFNCPWRQMGWSEREGARMEKLGFLLVRWVKIKNLVQFSLKNCHMVNNGQDYQDNIWRGECDLFKDSQIDKNKEGFK